MGCTACCEDAKHLPNCKSLEIRCSSDSPRLAGSMVGEFGVNKWGPTISTNFGGSMSGFFQVPWILHGFTHGFSLWKWPRSLTHCKALSGRASMSFSAPWAQHPWYRLWFLHEWLDEVLNCWYWISKDIYLETWESLTCCFFWGGFEDVVSTLKHVGGWFKSGRRISFISKVRQFHMDPSNAQPHNVPRRPSWNSAPGRNTEL